MTALSLLAGRTVPPKTYKKPSFKKHAYKQRERERERERGGVV